MNNIQNFIESFAIFFGKGFGAVMGVYIALKLVDFLGAFNGVPLLG